MTIEINEKLAEYITDMLERDFSDKFYSYMAIMKKADKVSDNFGYRVRLARRAYYAFSNAVEKAKRDAP